MLAFICVTNLHFLLFIIIISIVIDHLCQRVKGLRYRWQIRYREVSNTETASSADAKN